MLLPLSLTILSAATPAERRGAVLGAWGAVAAVAAALGPVLGGVLAGALSWHWIFWLNVPIGIALMPLARRRLTESHGPHTRLDLPGIALSSTGLLALVWALIDAGQDGPSSPRVMLAGAAGAAGIAAFVAWELRAPAPMVPMRFFRAPGFAGAIAASLLAYFGLFGALFLIGQLLQTGLGATPLHAGLGLLPMTGAMALTAPAAGAVCDRIGPRPLLTGALALKTCALTWVAATAPGATYAPLVPGLVLIGAACLFAPLQVTLLRAVRPAEHGQASGTATAARELGSVLGSPSSPASSPPMATPPPLPPSSRASAPPSPPPPSPSPPPRSSPSPSPAAHRRRHRTPSSPHPSPPADQRPHHTRRARSRSSSGARLVAEPDGRGGTAGCAPRRAAR
jgi:MFS family permease